MGKKRRWEQESSTSSSLSSSSSSDEEKKIRRKLKKYKNRYKMAISRRGPRSYKGKENEDESERYCLRSPVSLAPVEGVRASLPIQDGDLSDINEILPSEKEVEIETITLDEPLDVVGGEQLGKDPLTRGTLPKY